jgi:hypothetical protein
MKFLTTAMAMLLALLFTACLNAQAQFKQIAEGVPFEEPEDGVSKVVQMKNGNTFYLHLTKKEGIDLRIYDPQHTQTAATSITPSFGKLKAGTLQSFFEIKSDVVLFISEFEDNAPILYRLLFDGSTGKLKEEKTIAKLKRHGGMLATGLIDAFNVKRDLVGENYVVEIYNVFEDDKDKRTEIIQYDDNNNETNRTFLVTGNDDDYKFFVYMDMAVINAGKVAVFLYNGKEKYFYNTKKGKMVMALIDKKLNKVTYTDVDLPEKIKFSRCNAQYNAKTKKVYLMLLELNEKDRDNYNQYLTKINTETNQMQTSLVIDADDKLNDKYKEQFSKRSDYMGIYRTFFVNDDESYTIIYEEEYSNTSASGFGINKSYTTYTLGKIMVMNYNSKGEVVSGYIVPKSFNDNTFSYFKSFLYLDAGKNKYMMINDTERNNDVKKDKYVTITGVSECDAFFYNLTGDNIVPKRDYIFGSNADGHNLCFFRVSNYNKATNTLVTLKLNKKSPGDKYVKLVWLQPQ